MTMEEIYEANYGTKLPLFPTFYVTPDRPLTEDRIEREAERLMDRADAELLAGNVKQEHYDRWCKRLNEWTKEQFATIR